jgi:hypothetical protein
MAEPTVTQPQEMAPAQAPTQALATQEVAQEITTKGTDPGSTELDAKSKAKAENYVSILMNELHSPQTRDDVLEILKSSKDPFITIPQAALVINDAAKVKIERSGGKVDMQTMFLGSPYLVGDLMELGNAAGIFQVTKEDFPDLYQDSLQMYIQRGLKDGSIDPIELQLAGEKVMSQNQRVGGQYLAQEQGMPHAPTQAQILQQKERSTKQKVMTQVEDQRSKEVKAQNDQQVRQALLVAQQGR